MNCDNLQATVKDLEINLGINKEIIKNLLESDNYAMLLSLTYTNKKTGRFYFIFTSYVTENLVGLSNDTNTVYKTAWELVREDIFGSKRFMIFRGWDEGTQRYTKFDNYKIAIESYIIHNIYDNLGNIKPKVFSLENKLKIIGLENINI